MHPYSGGTEAKRDRSGPMPHFLFLAGPPAGRRMWSQVTARVQNQGAEATALDLLDLDTVAEDGPGWTDALARRVLATPDCVLVAHGSAVPLALHAAAQSPPTGLVLSNGPMGTLPAAISALFQSTRLPGNSLWSQPKLALSWLASSAGLRRTVVNPYVWDHDTVVTICGPLFEAGMARNRTRRFVGALPTLAAEAPRPPCPTLLCWGDSDPFFKASKLDISEFNSPIIPILGGHHYHPLERPWEIADAVMAWASPDLTTT